MAELDLHFVDELIGVRQQQHGGNRGAPRLEAAGVRQGASINRSCIVMLSALLQTYTEEVFQRAVRTAFPALRRDPENFNKWWKQYAPKGNPSDEHLNRIFLQIGVPDVFDGLTWQGTDPDKIKTKLNHINQLRNRIAHGAGQLTINNQPYSLSLAKVVAFRNFCEQFGSRFETHAIRKVRRSKLKGIARP